MSNASDMHVTFIFHTFTNHTYSFLLILNCSVGFKCHKSAYSLENSNSSPNIFLKIVGIFVLHYSVCMAFLYDTLKYHRDIIFQKTSFPIQDIRMVFNLCEFLIRPTRINHLLD